MAVDWDSDVLAPCFAVFAEAVQPTFTPAASAPGQPAYTIDGVFDRAYLEVVQLDSKSGASSLRPILGVRLAQFAIPPIPSDTVAIASVGITFEIRDVQQDGQGWALLELNRIC
jgi:hypothetical protein